MRRRSPFCVLCSICLFVCFVSCCCCRRWLLSSVVLLLLLLLKLVVAAAAIATEISVKFVCLFYFAYGTFLSRVFRHFLASLFARSVIQFYSFRFGPRTFHAEPDLVLVQSSSIFGSCLSYKVKLGALAVHSSLHGALEPLLQLGHDEHTRGERDEKEEIHR